MMTLHEAAQLPEIAERYNRLSPDAQRSASNTVAFLDTFPESRQDLALLGLECLAYAGSDRPLPDHIKAAQLGATYERARLCSLPQSPEHFEDVDPVITLIDDGERSGIKLERYDWHERGEQPRIWLEFTIAGVLTSVDITGGSPGLDLIINDVTVADQWTLADLKRLHTALGKLLADERLIGALAEQH